MQMTITEVVLISCNVFLAGLLVWREWQNRQERRDLLDRIMCQDYQTYKRLDKAAGPTPRPHVLPGRMSEAALSEAAKEQDKANA